jgi:peptidoglycan/xylan/chitin deacetylase (PgdA/CDA1 family)
MKRFRCTLLALSLAYGSVASEVAQQREVAITFDDLPYVEDTLGRTDHASDASEAKKANKTILRALNRRHVPATGLVIEKRVQEMGVVDGTFILQDWVKHGFDLGNHSYSHADFNQLSIEEVEHEITGGEATYARVMENAGKQPHYFRFPMNHTGNTQEKHDAIANFLAKRNYRLATCTIDNSDYLFNDAYVRMLAKRDIASAATLRSKYLAYTSAEIDYYAGLTKEVFGYEPPQVMLLHDSRLNADMIEQILKLFENKQYRFVTLDEAQSDPAYSTPDTFITTFGPMWGYRWAAERHVKVNGTLEPDPPAWILEYGKN